MATFGIGGGATQVLRTVSATYTNTSVRNVVYTCPANTVCIFTMFAALLHATSTVFPTIWIIKRTTNDLSGGNVDTDVAQPISGSIITAGYYSLPFSIVPALGLNIYSESLVLNSWQDSTTTTVYGAGGFRNSYNALILYPGDSIIIMGTGTVPSYSLQYAIAEYAAGV
jgi:hypothetical protein